MMALSQPSAPRTRLPRKMSTSSIRAASPTATRAMTSGHWPIMTDVRQRLQQSRPDLHAQGELQRALDELNLAVKFISNNQSRFLHHYNRARVEGLLKQYEASLADYAEAQKVNPDGPQVPAYRC